VEARFAAWAAATARQDSARQAAQAELFSLAAEAEGNLVAFPAGTRLRRLPPFFSSFSEESATQAGESAVQASALYQRHEGGLLSRALGRAVHLLLEELTGLHAVQPLAEACAALAARAPRAASQVRAAGLDAAAAERLGREALRLALQVAADPVGAWILAPHAEAESEPAWCGFVEGRLRTLRPDRVFLAGENPSEQGSGCWWIVDWKTAEAASESGARSLAELRAIFAPQLAAYAALLRRLKGNTMPIRAGLYYPRLRAFDFWPVESSGE
jgi:hypothetical protein